MSMTIAIANPFAPLPVYKPVRVLMVEDDSSDVFLTKRLLNGQEPSCRFSFTDVPRLSEAAGLLEKESFDLVLLDLQLLDAGGLSPLSVLRAAAPALPIVVFSGMSDEFVRGRAMRCGADAYLVKGRESGKLKDLIRGILARK